MIHRIVSFYFIDKTLITTLDKIRKIDILVATPALETSLIQSSKSLTEW